MDQPRALIACSLAPSAAERQLAEWAALVAAATGIEAIEQGARLTLSADLVEPARDLAEREAGCCTFLSFEWSDLAEDGIELTITANDPAGVPVVRSITGLLVT